MYTANHKLILFVTFLIATSLHISSQEAQLEVISIDTSGNGTGVGVFVNGQGNGYIADGVSHRGFSALEAGTIGFFSNLSAQSGFVSAGAGDNGFYSLSAGEDGFSSSSATDNGFSAFSSGEHGFYSQGTGTDGFQAVNSGRHGFYSRGAFTHGFIAENSGSVGVLSVDATSHGMAVQASGGYGFYANMTSDASFYSRESQSTGFYAYESTANSFQSFRSGGTAFGSQDAMGNGVFVSGSQGSGIVSTESGERAGFFVNSATSTAAEAMVIGHGDNSKTDLVLLGTGRLNAERSIVLTLDQNDDDANSSFIIRNGDGIEIAEISENGNASFAGNISKGGGTFKIDHPQYPTEMYLYHSFIESPDMMNIYNGNIVTDSAGYATVTLPSYFESLNRDYKYQLTSIGTFGQAIIKEEIQNGQFVIQTEHPNCKVSWQVTGVRQDPYAEAHRVQVEVEKEEDKKGTLLHPEVRGIGERRTNRNP